jgi:hypothetical protein
VRINESGEAPERGERAGVALCYPEGKMSHRTYEKWEEYRNPEGGDEDYHVKPGKAPLLGVVEDLVIS